MPIYIKAQTYCELLPTASSCHFTLYSRRKPFGLRGTAVPSSPISSQFQELERNGKVSPARANLVVSKYRFTYALQSHSPTALASLIQLDRPFDEKALRNLRNDAYRKGIPGLLIAGVESITGVFLMFHYGRVTTGGDLLNAATKLPPPYNNLQYVKPLEEGDHWNEAVSAFDGCDVSWRAKIRPVCSPCIYVKTLTGKTVSPNITTTYPYFVWLVLKLNTPT